MIRFLATLTFSILIVSCGNSRLSQKNPAAPTSEIFNAYMNATGSKRLADGVALLPRKAESYASNIKSTTSRQWGTEYLIDTIKKSADQLWEENGPYMLDLNGNRVRADRLIVGDISHKNGGKLAGHKSHRWGLDIDLGYFTKVGYSGEQTRKVDVFTTRRGVTKEFDGERTLRFVELVKYYAQVRCSDILFVFVDKKIRRELKRVFLARESKKLAHQRLGLDYFNSLNFNDEANHHHHFHIRLARAPRDHCYNQNGNILFYSDDGANTDPVLTQDDTDFSSLDDSWNSRIPPNDSVIAIQDDDHISEDDPFGDNMGQFELIANATIWSADINVENLGYLPTGTRFYVTEVYRQRRGVFYEFTALLNGEPKQVLVNAVQTHQVIEEPDSDPTSLITDNDFTCYSQESNRFAMVTAYVLNLRSEKRTFWNRPKIGSFEYGTHLEVYESIEEDRRWIKVRGVDRSGKVKTGVVYFTYIVQSNKRPDHLCQ